MRPSASATRFAGTPSPAASLRITAATTALLLFSGCQAGYVLKQGFRQLARPLEEIRLDAPNLAVRVGPEVAAKLRWVPLTLDFCRRQLGLDPGDSYQSYVDTGGRPVSYAVTAAHPRALIPCRWHFPFVGDVPYKGYFDETDARREAERLRGKGLDTLVSPVGAYSTLGWFRDPVVSSMLEGSTADLIDVIIHETTHRTVYFPGAASFNESLATYIARRGTELFLAAHEGLTPLHTEYLAEKADSRERELLLLRLRNDLDALYKGPLADGEMDARKKEIFATASAACRHLLPAGEGRGLPPSNAFVLSVAWYHEYEPLLADLERRLGGRPIDLMAYLGKLPRSEDPVEVVSRLRLEGSSPAQ